MPIIATDGTRKSDFVKHQYEQSTLTQEVIVMNDAATTIKPATALGKVTATGKWKVCKQAASDGSQNVAGFYIGTYGLGDWADTTLANNTDQKVLALTNGPAIVGAEYIVWDASFTTQAQKDAALATLTAGTFKVAPQLAKTGLF